MAYVRKADRVQQESNPNTVSELKGQLSEVEALYVSKLENAWLQVGVPSMKRYTNQGDFQRWYELGCSNKVKHPQLIDHLIRIARVGKDDDIRCEAETLLAVHGATQIFGSLIA